MRMAQNQFMISCSDDQTEADLHPTEPVTHPYLSIFGIHKDVPCLLGPVVMVCDEHQVVAVLHPGNLQCHVQMRQGDHVFGILVL